jgi:hypothetical protein
MRPLSTIQQWLEAGKQLGAASYEKSGQTHWASVGIQWWNGTYKIYLSDIPEALMATPEEDLQEALLEAAAFEDIAEVLAARTRITLESLTPCKGHKIFEPKFS